MSDPSPSSRFMFPRWTNVATYLAIAVALGGPAYALGLFFFIAHPDTLTRGYMPEQPVPYSHAIHVGQLGMDCRYCHNTVEQAGHAAVPATETCISCHGQDHGKIGLQKLTLLPVRESYAQDKPIEWIKIHKIGDYAYFNHSAHVARGVGCVSCHGRVDRMEKVFQSEPISMAWCLDCHRNPEKHLRPKDQVTNMDWVPPEDQIIFGLKLKKQYNINPSTDCSTCHR